MFFVISFAETRPSNGSFVGRPLFVRIVWICIFYVYTCEASLHLQINHIFENLHRLQWKLCVCIAVVIIIAVVWNALLDAMSNKLWFLQEKVVSFSQFSTRKLQFTVDVIKLKWCRPYFHLLQVDPDSLKAICWRDVLLTFCMEIFFVYSFKLKFNEPQYFLVFRKIGIYFQKYELLVWIQKRRERTVSNLHFFIFTMKRKYIIYPPFYVLTSKIPRAFQIDSGLSNQIQQTYL